jgi:hypothetical protein
MTFHSELNEKVSRPWVQTRSGIRHKIPSVSSKRPRHPIKPSFPLRDIYNAAQLSLSLHTSLRPHFFVSGSSSMPSASNRLRASSKAHVCMLFTCYQPPGLRIFLITLPTSYLACSSTQSPQIKGNHRIRRTTHSPTLHSRTSRLVSRRIASRSAGRNGLRVRGRPRSG